MTTDNASNIIAAIAILKRQRVGCFSNTFQLSVQKALNLPVMSRAIARGKQPLSFFCEIPQCLASKAERPEHKLIQVNLKLEYDSKNTFYIVFIGCN